MLNLQHLVGLAALPLIGARYLATLGAAAGAWSVSKRDKEQFTALSAPPTVAGTRQAVLLSSCGNYAAVAHSSGPYISFFKRNGDSYSKLSDPASLPAGTVAALAACDDFGYVAVGVSGGVVDVYKRTGDSFQKISTSIPGGSDIFYGSGLAFSSDGVYLAVGWSDAGLFNEGVEVFKRDGDAFTSVYLDSFGFSSSVSLFFSRGASHLFIVKPTSTISVLKRTGDSFTPIASPGSLPSSVLSADISPDGTYLAVGGSVPTLSLQKMVGDDFTYLGQPDTLPGSSVSSVAWSRDGLVLFASQPSSPYGKVYARRSGALYVLSDPSGLTDGGSPSFSGEPYGTF